ncbi:MAG: molybdate ABC transporter permease subunit [Acidobacteria bacterium]|nr:molybdate ABC transporter permease subunit [Acidobacteriota bacterium]
MISIATTCTATIATFFLGLCAAREMYRVRGSLRAWIDGVLTLPLVLPPTVVGFFLLLIFGRRSFTGHLLEQIGVTIVFSWPATVIAATVVAFPLMYRTSLGALEQVNPTLLQAARTLGASEWVVFRRVQLPLAGPGVLAGTVLAFARAMGEFGATLMLAGNIPGRTQTMPIAIFSAAESGDMRSALLWVGLIVVLSLAIIRLLHYEKRLRPTHTVELQGTVSEQLAVVPAPQTDGNGSATHSLDVNAERRLENFVLNISLRTSRGAIGLLGPSGAGKSMTLRMIAGLTAPDRGRIVLNDRVLFDSNSKQNLPAAQRRIGVVFQDYALFPHLTVAENVGFGLRQLPVEERRVRVNQHLTSMQIADLADRYPREISGGQRQRVAIARCMATDPDALLLDEPFAALDPHLRRQTEEQLRRALAGFKGPVVFVTHDMEEAFRFCTNLLVLDRGMVIASGRKHQLFEDPGTVAAAQLTGCKNIVKAVRIGSHRIFVTDWECELETSQEVDAAMTHIGFRSHQVRFMDGSGDNVFPCWLASINEAPHEMTLYLRLHAPASLGDTAHLQADVPKDLWRVLSSKPQPWNIQLLPERVLVLRAH